MREPEGISTPPPAKSSESTWSKHREPDIRIVEVGGSSPLTSTTTKGQVRGLEWIPGSWHSAGEHVTRCRESFIVAGRPFAQDPAHRCRSVRTRTGQVVVIA